MKHHFTLLTFILLLCFQVNGQKYPQILKFLDDNTKEYEKIAFDIWEYAELGFLEEKSSSALQNLLKGEGFSIKAGIADMPTAFVAEYGSGFPIIAILGEFDALPGLSQEAFSPEQNSIGQEAGHACGHHLFGTASSAAAIAVKKWMEENKGQGTIRFYGCPAEEGGSGKVFMVREGVFDDVDIVLHWHPDEQNDASAGAALSIKSAKFKFYGSASHAAWSPHRGRSALDGVEAMNIMVNMMREHVPDAARIHYVITHGGNAPNIVPDYAEVYYYVRHNNYAEVQNLFSRIEDAAKGAALGTGTRMEVEVTGGSYEMLPNLTLQRIVYDNLTAIGGVEYTPTEIEFANKLVKTLNLDKPNMSMATDIKPYKEQVQGYGSTDVGDVSFMAPTAGLYTATWVPGTPAHSWQAVSCGKSTIATKGMMNAAKVLAQTSIQILENPKIAEEAQKEFQERRGSDFVYKPLIGDVKPDVDRHKKK